MFTGNHAIGYASVLDDVMQKQGITIEDLASKMGGAENAEEIQRNLKSLLTVHNTSSNALKAALVAAGATEDEIERAIAINKGIVGWKKDFDEVSKSKAEDAVNKFWTARDAEFASKVEETYKKADELIQVERTKAAEKAAAKEKKATAKEDATPTEAASAEPTAADGNPFEE